MVHLSNHQIIPSRHGKFIGQRELISKSTQLKVFYVARPLISLWRLIDPSTEEGRMLENAIELWAEAHFFISKDRIENVMNSVYSIFKNFLKDPSKFLRLRSVIFLVRILRRPCCRQRMKTASYKK
jgi:hypothetical protein